MKDNKVSTTTYKKLTQIEFFEIMKKIEDTPYSCKDPFSGFTSSQIDLIRKAFDEYNCLLSEYSNKPTNDTKPPTTNQ